MEKLKDEHNAKKKKIRVEVIDSVAYNSHLLKQEVNRRGKLKTWRAVS